MRFPAVLLVIPLVPLPVFAQYYSINGAKWNNPVSASLDTMLTHSIQRKALERTIAKNKATAAAAAEPDARDFVFRSSGSPRVVQSIADSIGSTLEQRRQYAQVFGVVLEQMTGALRKDGDPYDLSKAMALYIASMYQVLHPETNLDERASENLLREIRSQLMDAAAVRSVPDRPKQDLWESLLIFAGFAHAGYAKSLEDRDAAAQKVFRTMAEEGLRSLFHVEPSRLRLSPQAAEPLGVDR